MLHVLRLILNLFSFLSDKTIHTQVSDPLFNEAENLLRVIRQENT